MKDHRGVGPHPMLHHVAAELVTQQVGVPFGAGQQVLEPVNVGMADVDRHLPGVLARHLAEEGPDQVAEDTACLRAFAQQVRDPLGQGPELVRALRALRRQLLDSPTLEKLSADERTLVTQPSRWHTESDIGCPRAGWTSSDRPPKKAAHHQGFTAMDELLITNRRAPPHGNRAMSHLMFVVTEVSG